MRINYLFIFVCIFLIASAIHGYKKGFLRIAITLVGLVVITMVVTKIAPIASTYIIEKTSAYESIRSRVSDAFSDGAINIEETESQNQIVESYDLPELITGALLENNIEQSLEEESANAFREYASGYLSKMIIRAGTFIGLVAILWAALTILLFTADVLGKIPVLKTFNRLMGLGCGVMVGIMVVWLLFLVVIAFIGGDISKDLMACVKENNFLSYLFNTNPLFRFIK